MMNACIQTGKRAAALIVVLQLLAGVLLAQEIKVEKVAEGFVFPEGPVWHPDGYLLFSDVDGAVIEKLTSAGVTEKWFDQGKKTNGLLLSPDATKLYACSPSELQLLEIDMRTKTSRVLAGSYDGHKFNNVNDLTLDREGNLFFTDPKWGQLQPEDVQGVYCYRQGTVRLAAKLDKQPNGLAVSPDQKWLYVDRCGADEIWRYELQKDGTLTSGVCWAKLEPNAAPDGMTIDSKGNLYVAQSGNGKVCVVSPEGRILKLIPVFERIATNCEFEGQNENVLYVTGGNKGAPRPGAVCKITFLPGSKTW